MPFLAHSVFGMTGHYTLKNKATASVKPIRLTVREEWLQKRNDIIDAHYYVSVYVVAYKKKMSDHSPSSSHILLLKKD